MAKTDAELLADTRVAIDALTTGGAVSYTLNGRTVTKLSLDQLWDQVARLEARIAKQKRGGRMFGVAVNRRPR